VLIGAGPAWAEGGEALRGTLTHEDVPVAGVSISVYTEDGELIETVATGEDGTWRVAVPGPGTYRVDLDESTLPSGVVVRNGRPSLTPEVFGGAERNVLFPLGTEVVGGPDPGQTAGPTTPGSGEQPGGQSSSGSGRYSQVF